MTETEIQQLAKDYWEADKKLTFQSFRELYAVAFRRAYLVGFSHGEAAEARRILERFQGDEVSGAPV